MTTSHHTPIQEAVVVSSGQINAALSTIDQAIGFLEDGSNTFVGDVDGGTIDGNVIGGSTPSTGVFTNIAATGNMFGPAWHVTMGGGTQAIATVTTATVQFDTEVLDSNADFNTGTYTLTPTVEGWYMCIAQTTWNATWNAAKSMQVSISQTGGTAGAGLTMLDTGGAQKDTVLTYDIAYCNGSSDTIHVLAYNGDSTSRSIDGTAANTYFAGWRIQ